MTLYGSEWLLRPNLAQISISEARYHSMGLPGCIGYVDFAVWQWETIPDGWKGMYMGKDKKPTCSLEVLCDDSLRIFHVSFGITGPENDTSVMYQSELFNEIITDLRPPVRPLQCVSGCPLRKFYFLADGIYSLYLFFALTHISSHTCKEKLYSAHHSSSRMTVERYFGVLFPQFRNPYLPSRLWNVSDIVKVLTA